MESDDIPHRLGVAKQQNRTVERQLVGVFQLRNTFFYAKLLRFICLLYLLLTAFHGTFSGHKICSISAM